MYNTTISQCIDPVSLSEFVSIYWNKAVFYQIRSDNRFADLFSTLEADRLISDKLLQYPLLRVIKDGPVPLSQFTSSNIQIGRNSLEGVIDAVKVAQFYKNGATIIFQGLQWNCKNLADFCKELEVIIKLGISANAYLTPSNSQGFGAHFDNESVFILQLEGEKVWKIYERPFVNPRNESIAVRNNLEDRKCIEEITLQPGSFLYIPRGHFHEAYTKQGHSLHITLSIREITYADILFSWLQKFEGFIESNIELKHVLPFGSDANVEDIIEQISASAHKHLIDTFQSFPLESIRDVVRNTLLKGLSSRNTAMLTQVNRLGTLRSDSLIKRVENIPVYVKYSDDDIILLLPDKQILLPSSFREVISFITTRESFKISELPLALEEMKVKLIERLVGEGILYILNKPEQG